MPSSEACIWDLSRMCMKTRWARQQRKKMMSLFMPTHPMENLMRMRQVGDCTCMAGDTNIIQVEEERGPIHVNVGCRCNADAILLHYNSLPCGTECFIGCREASRPTSKKKRHLLLAVASGCRHVICPFVITFLVGCRHLTIFGKYLLPFSFYISVQCYC